MHSETLYVCKCLFGFKKKGGATPPPPNPPGSASGPDCDMHCMVGHNIHAVIMPTFIAVLMRVRPLTLEIRDIPKKKFLDTFHGKLELHHCKYQQYLWAPKGSGGRIR